MNNGGGESSTHSSQRRSLSSSAPDVPSLLFSVGNAAQTHAYSAVCLPFIGKLSGCREIAEIHLNKRGFCSGNVWIYCFHMKKNTTFWSDRRWGHKPFKSNLLWQKKEKVRGQNIAAAGRLPRRWAVCLLFFLLLLSIWGKAFQEVSRSWKSEKETSSNTFKGGNVIDAC